MLTSNADYEIRTLKTELERTERQIAEMKRLLAIKESLAAGIRAKIEARLESRRRREPLEGLTR
jgi:hypothetical protein